jgi:hypothetical protein
VKQIKKFYYQKAKMLMKLKIYILNLKKKAARVNPGKPTTRVMRTKSSHEKQIEKKSQSSARTQPIIEG